MAMTTSTQPRIAASQLARIHFEDYRENGGGRYACQHAWNNDEPSPDYSLWEMPEPTGLDSDEAGDLDTVEWLWR